MLADSAITTPPTLYHKRHPSCKLHFLFTDKAGEKTLDQRDVTDICSDIIVAQTKLGRVLTSTQSHC